jgi:hypothetical protein
MAPKRQKGQLPKAMGLLKEMLGTDSVTADLIAAADGETRKRAFSAMNAMLAVEFPAKATLYKTLSNDEERREFMAEILLDVENGGNVLRNVIRRQVDEDDDDAEVWLTLSELSGPKGYNDKDIALLAVAGMQSRPHKQNAALREAGILQYMFEFDTKTNRKKKSTISELETTQDVEAGDAAGVRDFMQSNSNKVAVDLQRADPNPSGSAPSGRPFGTGQLIPSPLPGASLEMRPQTGLVSIES